ncbi:MAG: CCA tRNA nucleotidyltransferase [Anaerolineae bacterium]|nr:CCA tRNA nucleotidyltransferase [Anaerolineae bacterium]
MITLPQVTSVIQSLMKPGEHLYLVGGAVRDALLSKPNQDLDFVCTGDPRIIGRKLADKLSGASYMLDEERNACRVIVKNEQDGFLVFDFTQIRGQTLNDDLLERDFTINAIAIDLKNPSEIIDPLNGSKDLVEKWLRPCKETSFIDDPLRGIRAIRYAVKYDLDIAPSTIDLLKSAIDNLSLISKERKRDELFKILEIEKPASALELFAQYNMLEHLSLSAIPSLHNALVRLKILTELTKSSNEENPGKPGIESKPNYLGSIFSENMRFLRERFDQVNLSGRSIRVLDALITLLWDLNEEEGAKAIEGLALSREEQELVCISLRHKCWILDQFSSQKVPERQFVYRYYQSLGIAGLDVAVLTLVEAVSNPSFDWGEAQRSELGSFCQKLVEIFERNPEYVYPKLYLTGRDLMFEFDIPQGPRIGQLLEGLREQQAIGLIENRTQANAWVDRQIQKGFIKG